METKNVFAERICTLRRERKLTQAQIAEMVGISKTSANQYENMTRVPDIQILAKYAQVLGVTADYLLGISDNRTNETAAIGDKLGMSDGAITFLSNAQKYIKIHNGYMAADNDETLVNLMSKIILFDNTNSSCDLIKLINDDKSNIESALGMFITKIQAVLDLLIANSTVLIALNDYLTAPEVDLETCEDLNWDDYFDAEKMEALAMYRLQKELIELRKNTKKFIKEDTNAEED